VYARSTIYDPADNSVKYNTNDKIGELVTDENANATMSNLYLGEYYIKELQNITIVMPNAVSTTLPWMLPYN